MKGIKIIKWLLFIKKKGVWNESNGDKHLIVGAFGEWDNSIGLNLG